MSNTKICEPKKATNYNVNSINVDVFYYNKYDNNKILKRKYTPNKNHTINTKKYEGIYHPSCKLKNYPELTFTDIGIIKVDGNKDSFYDYFYDYDKDQNDLIKINKEKGAKLNDPKIIALIVCALHALKERLKNDINNLNNRIIIDNGHLIAHKYIIRFIVYHLQILQDINNSKPGFDNIIKTNDVIEIYKLIEKYQNTKKGETKDSLLTEINNYYSSMNTNQRRKRLDFNKFGNSINTKLLVKWEKYLYSLNLK